MAMEGQRLSDEERADLVAYLDGELAEERLQTLGTKLIHSVTGRREVEALQKTWELLDFLPRPTPSEDFASRTMTEVVKLDSRGGKFSAAAGRTGLWAARIATLAATALLTVALGYALARWAWPDPSARLVRDLPLAEHLDEYREVGSFELLRMLDQSPAFNEAE